MATFSWETVNTALGVLNTGAEVLQQIQQTLPGAVATTPAPTETLTPVVAPPAPPRPVVKKASKLSTPAWIAIGVGSLLATGGLIYALSRPPTFRRR